MSYCKPVRSRSIWRIISFQLLITIFFPALVLATAQECDILILNGKKYCMYSNPLEDYLAKNPERRPHPEETISSNWRGYIATWEVQNDYLVLKDVEILIRSIVEDRRSKREYRSVISELFPGKNEIVADWVTGHILIPNGKLVKYSHMGYGSLFKKYIILRIENGLVTKNWKANLKKYKLFRESQFASYKKTEEYQSELAKARKKSGSIADTMSEQDIENFLFDYLSGHYLSMIFDDN